MGNKSEPSTILVIDDEPEMRTAVSESIKQLGHTVLTAPSAEAALDKCHKPLALILVDNKMPGITGIEFLTEIRKKGIRVPTILMSAYGSIQIAVEAMKAGASDYLVKPFSYDVLRTVIERALSKRVSSPLSPSIRNNSGMAILTKDPAMLKLLRMADIVAASPTTAMIEGESGTGKELLARYIHEQSPRSHRPFIAVNCAAVPESLLESELFGFEKGAFTGASVRKPGRFELANTGTILLDEISEMQLSIQAKLLRVLQEREVDPLGSKGPIALDIRIISTTNRPLWEEVKGGRFREDLYYRLNVFPLRLPPIRARSGDIPLLVNHFIERSSYRSDKKIKDITSEAMSVLLKRPWRGNIRELQNVVERACLLAETGSISPEHLLFYDTNDTATAESKTKPTTLWESERALILETLNQSGGNRTHSARRLGISIRTLRNKLREYRGTGLIPSAEDLL